VRVWGQRPQKPEITVENNTEEIDVAGKIGPDWLLITFLENGVSGNVIKKNTTCSVSRRMFGQQWISTPRVCESL